jgi:uncharacterized Fe-S cluster protein YjdI/CDGSH-type Zn-finger protein
MPSETASPGLEHDEMTSEPQAEARHQAAVERTYTTDAIEIRWEPGLCIHFGACFRGSIEAFDPRRRPWVMPAAEAPERIDEIVAGCPTGALHVRWLDGRPAVSEPQDGVTVAPQLDGPLFLRGPVEIRDREGNLVRADTRMALCRCGHSANKPFCDDSHYRVGFRSNDPQLGTGNDG